MTTTIRGETKEKKEWKEGSDTRSRSNKRTQETCLVMIQKAFLHA